MKIINQLLCAGLLVCAQAAWALEINLGSIADAVKGVAKSREIGSMSDEDEIAVGKEVAARTLGAYPPVQSEKLQRYLNNVGLWVALQSERPNLPWRFAAVESAQVNAFAVPGGTVLVTMGMLNLLANEAELGCVLGHEVGHIVRRHHINLLQSETLTQTGTKLISDNLRGNSAVAKSFALGQGAELFTRSLDRGAERDADQDGVVLAARAGYDPASCLNFMERLAGLKQQQGAMESLYKTHPQAADRAAEIGKILERLEGATAGNGARPPMLVKK